MTTPGQSDTQHKQKLRIISLYRESSHRKGISLSLNKRKGLAELYGERVFEVMKAPVNTPKQA
jgi:hypothetical protein